jgi:hypothetical protein
MSKYVNADELLKRLPDDLPYKASVKRVLMQAPTADVVEVVRCKNCKYCEEAHYEEEGEKPYIKLKCKWSNYSHQPNDYCSYGERSENGK